LCVCSVSSGRAAFVEVQQFNFKFTIKPEFQTEVQQIYSVQAKKIDVQLV
jgi:hypothetical protein